MKYIKNNKGFSLVEMIVAMIIIGIAMSMVIYNISIIFKTRVDTIADQYKTDIRNVKDSSISSDGKTYSVLWEDTGTNFAYILYSDSDIIKRVDLHPEIDVTHDGGNVSGSRILFDSLDGKVIDDAMGLNGAGEYLFMNSSGDTSTVIIFKETGRID